MFDGETPSDFKDWCDNVFTLLEIEEIEEHVEDSWKDKDIPTKVSTDRYAICVDKVITSNAGIRTNHMYLEHLMTT